ncbi:hypothetical protein [Gorillibacterium sp. sgz5001074]|uniref:hypothetical protein n=1 Tax=Gorillibacterium sp. sgz5001074 TaxID=3446695 RepID=UPI003F67C9D3
MYQSQQFHTSNYRGNQQGHDSYLRADSQSPSNFGTQNVTSQYRGIQKTFQPTGMVNSVYGQSGFNQQPTSSFGGSYSTSTGTQNYHTANYRGDQQGHDSYLRGDSRQPSQSQYSGASNLGTTGFSTSAYNPSNTYNTGSFGNAGVSTYNQNQFVSPESYHTSNYRGDQQGHDSYLRGDSRQPAQSQFGIGSSGTTFGNVATSSYNNVNANIGTSTFGGAGFGTSNLGVSSFGTSNYNNSSFAPSNIGTSSFGGGSTSFGQNQNQFVSPESYHTSSYRGDQQGHDSYLRGDSRQPAQSQFGAGMTSGSFGSFGGNRF